jgi:N-hydroxyarylamine O-acetyltransferase
VTPELDAYFARIRVVPEPRPSVDNLDALVWGHLTHVPFENLDILLDRAIKIDLASVTTKLVTERRGGYCFEHNTLFAAVLRELGFGVVPLSARVRWGASGPTPRTHMLLEVVVDGRSYLADVGFGGTCPTRAIPLEPGEYDTRHGRLRLSPEPDGFLVLELAGADGWSPMYAFTREEHFAIDFEVANHYTSTYPGSRFVTAPIIALTTQHGRITYANGELTEREGPEVTARRTIATGDQLLGMLAERFGLVFPSGTRFRGAPQ